MGACALVVAVTIVAPGVSWGDSTPQPLSAEGGSFIAPIMNLLLNDPAAVAALTPFEPSYFDANIDVARQDFAAGLNDYAVSELPLTSAEAATATQNGRSFAYVPFAASPITIAAVVECQGSSFLTPQTMCANLEATVPILAQLFCSTPTQGIYSWNSPSLTTLDPSTVDVQAPSKSVLPLEQVQPSVSNLALETLFENDPSAKVTWEDYLQYYNQSTDFAPSELWPVTNQGVSGGDSALAQDLVPENELATPPLPIQNPTLWGLGEVAPIPADWIGAPRNIPTIAIQNAAGDFVSPTVPAMQAALGDATMDPTTNLVTFNANPNDAAAYPIPEMSYLIVPTSGLAPAKAQALSTLIKFILGSAGQADVESLGAAPVTPAMITVGLQVADEVAAQTGGTAATTSTTTPTGTTATTATTTATTATTTATTADNGAVSTASQSAPTGNTGSGSDTTNTASSTSPSLALTGGLPWPVPLVGAALALIGFVSRRTMRWRSLAKGRPR